ncbi:MAG: phosphonate ABC transporter, permease protein PhnE [Nitrososphaerota archaeon]
MDRLGRYIGGSLIILALIYSAHQVGLTDLPRLLRGAYNIGQLVSEVFPPNLEVLPETLSALTETVQMAFLGTFLGFIFSLPLCTLGLRTMFPPSITTPVRIIMGAVRTIPALFWAVIYVIAVGLGPLAGTLAISTYTLGYLSKIYYEAFEAVDNEVLDALRCAGASRPSLIRFAVIPESMNTVVSQLLFMLEYNVRSSTILGFVGAGGVGFLMISYIERLQYQRLTTVIALTLLVVITIDLVSSTVRRRFLPPLRLAPTKARTTNREA